MEGLETSSPMLQRTIDTRLHDQLKLKIFSWVWEQLPPRYMMRLFLNTG